MILLFAVAPGVSIAAAGELLGPGRGRLAFRVLGGTLLLVGTLIGSMSGPHTDKPSASDIRRASRWPRMRCVESACAGDYLLAWPEHEEPIKQPRGSPSNRLASQSISPSQNPI